MSRLATTVLLSVNSCIVLATSKLGLDKTQSEHSGNPIKIITFHDMIREIQGKLTKTLAATEVGRLLQLFSASRPTLEDG
jgi:hypothetical protein